jgi:hypothetical protein
MASHCNHCALPILCREECNIIWSGNNQYPVCAKPLCKEWYDNQPQERKEGPKIEIVVLKEMDFDPPAQEEEEETTIEFKEPESWSEHSGEEEEEEEADEEEHQNNKELAWDVDRYQP